MWLLGQGKCPGALLKGPDLHTAGEKASLGGGCCKNPPKNL